MPIHLQPIVGPGFLKVSVNGTYIDAAYGFSGILGSQIMFSFLQGRGSTRANTPNRWFVVSIEERTLLIY